MPDSGLSGIGIGLRASLLRDLLEGDSDDLPSFIEITPEHFMQRGGMALRALENVAERLPVLTHSISMSLGGVDPVDPEYGTSLAAFVARYDPPWHSDHLAFSSMGGIFFHELLPIPFQHKTAERVARRIREASDRLERPMAVENIAWHLQMGRPDYDEGEFLTEVVSRADCGLVLDLNNAYINAKNHGTDVYTWLRKIPMARIVQIHIAGHEIDDSGVLIDTHGADVCDELYEILAWVIERVGPKPVVLERDRNIPPLSALTAEIRRANSFYRTALGRWQDARAESVASIHE